MKISPFFVWFGFLLCTAESLLQYHWEAALVVFSAMRIVPRGLKLLDYEPGWWYPFLVAGLMYSYYLWPDEQAVFWALPYALWALWLVVWEFSNMLVFKRLKFQNVLRAAALGYWATGAIWVIFFLADIRPFDFNPVMIGLTSAHFHVAGFVPAVAVYCLCLYTPGKTNRWLGYGILAGMPMVATGITLTQLGFSPVPEWLTATGFIALAFGMVWQHVTLALKQPYYSTQREMWIWASACLSVGLAMALVYAMRFYFPFKWFSIPNMRFWHGTLNTIGFGWLILRGWLAYPKDDD